MTLLTSTRGTKQIFIVLKSLTKHRRFMLGGLVHLSRRGLVRNCHFTTNTTHDTFNIYKRYGADPGPSKISLTKYGIFSPADLGNLFSDERTIQKYVAMLLTS